MKKILLGSTALVAMALSGAAHANDVELGLGGYMRVGAAISEFSSGGVESEESFHVIRDGEIHFKGKGTLDNGITIEARVELEAFTTGDQIDENWVRISGSFGKILIGSNDDAAYNAGYVGMGPTAVPNFSFYDHTLQFVPTGAGDMFTLVGGSDAMGIHYYTPNISGFSAGVSYHPDSSSDGGADGQTTGADNDDQIIAVGASYSNSFGEFDFAVGGGYITDDNERDAYGVGVELGFSGFTLYGRYEELEVDEDDTTGYAVGLGYNTGPWSFLAGYGYQDEDGGAEVSKIHGGVGYSLGKGVTVGGAIEWGDNDVDDGVAGALMLGVSF